MGDQLVIMWWWLRRLLMLPAAVWELIIWRWRYRAGVITFGCAGVLVITKVATSAVSPIGPWSVDLSGVSLLDGGPRHESSECDPDLVSPYLAQVLVGYQLGLDLDGSREHLRHLQERVPELSRALG